MSAQGLRVVSAPVESGTTMICGVHLLALLLFPCRAEPFTIKPDNGVPPRNDAPKRHHHLLQRKPPKLSTGGTALRSIARRGWSASGGQTTMTAGARQSAVKPGSSDAGRPSRESPPSSWPPSRKSGRAPWEPSVPRLCETPPERLAGSAALPWPKGAQSGASSVSGGRRGLLASDSKYKAQKHKEPSDGSPEERQAVEKLKQVVGGAGKVHPQWQSIISPPLGRHSLGSCAVVGLSSRLVGSCLGKAIDAHDTVFRFGGAPVKGWEMDVGSRKSVQLVRKPSESKCSNIDHDVWFKGSNEQVKNVSAADTRRPEKFYLMLGESAEKCGQRERVSSFKGTPVRYLNKYKDLIVPGSSDIYASFLTSREMQVSKDKRAKATGGFNFVLALITSQACRRIDLYGFGKGEGGHYFFHERASVKKSVDNRQGMKNVHSVGLENWLLRRAMAAKLLCIYDKQELSFGATCR